MGTPPFLTEWWFKVAPREAGWRKIICTATPETEAEKSSPKTDSAPKTARCVN